MSKYLLVFISVLFLAGCTTVQVSHDYNLDTDFSELATYSWISAEDKPSEDVRVNNDLVIDRVRKAVENNLDSKGFVKVEKDQADFLITWLGAVDKKIQADAINHFYSPYGYGGLYQDPYWGSSGRQTIQVREYEQGTIIIDFLNPTDKKLIWRGTGQERISKGMSPEDLTKYINISVGQILKKFPPEKK